MDSKTFIRNCFDFPNLFVHILFQLTIYRENVIRKENLSVLFKQTVY